LEVKKKWQLPKKKSLDLCNKLGISSKDEKINYVLAGLAKSVIVGTLFGTLTSVFFALRQPDKSVGKIIPAVFFSRITFNFIKYFSLLMAAPRVVDYALEKSQLIPDEDSRETVAGIFGGLSGTLFASNDITMFIGAKIVETLFVDLQESGGIPRLPISASHLYAFSIATIFTAFAFEPHNLRPSTFSSMVNYSGGNWLHFLKAFANIRSENGIPNKEAYQKWYNDLAAPLIKLKIGS